MSLTHGGGVAFSRDVGLERDAPKDVRVFRLAGTTAAADPRFQADTILVVRFSADDNKSSLPTVPVLGRAHDLAAAFHALNNTPGFVAKPADNSDQTPAAMPVTVAEDVDRFRLYDTLVTPEATPLTGIDQQTRDDLAAAMLDADLNRTSPIPAAYTYFGQFLAHDMTYMRCAERLNGVCIAWENTQHPHVLDFASLFGTIAKLGLPTSQWVASADCSLGLASTVPAGFVQTYDLPRRGATASACCVDARVDSNLALAQMHVLLARFHQKIAEGLGLSDAESKAATRQHLQAVVLTDYLPRIIPDAIYNDVMNNGRTVVATSGSFLVPLEFAAAVFRFGHSMVRPRYKPWPLHGPPGGFLRRAASLDAILTYTGEGVGNGGQLPHIWGQIWRHMVDMPGIAPGDKVMARPIMASVASPLGTVNNLRFPDVPVPQNVSQFSLPAQTLNRSDDFGLPSGQALATLVGLANPLDIHQFLVDRQVRFGNLSNNANLCSATPAWFYTLAEAEALGAGKLGPMAARIVMETFHAALAADPDGILDVSPTGMSSINFARQVRIGQGAINAFSLADVVGQAYGDAV